MEVAVAFVGVTTNATVTYTTREGTFPVTTTTFRVSNLGSGRIVQGGSYHCDTRGDTVFQADQFETGQSDLYGVVTPGQSRMVSIITPWDIHGPWRVVFHFSKYGWQHRVAELSPWEQEMARRFLPDKWLYSIPEQSVASGWVDVQAASR